MPSPARDGSSTASVSCEPEGSATSAALSEQCRHTQHHHSSCSTPSRKQTRTRPPGLLFLALLSLLSPSSTSAAASARLVWPSLGQGTSVKQTATFYARLVDTSRPEVVTSAAGALLTAAGVEEPVSPPNGSPADSSSLADVSLLGDLEPSLSSAAGTVFEDTLAATFPDTASFGSAVGQLSGLLSWLGTAAARASLYGGRIQGANGRSITPSNYNASSPLSNIPELKDFAVREIMYDAMQVAARPQNESTLLPMLDYIRSRLMQQVTKQMGYPITRRIIVGALLKRRMEDGPFSPAVHEMVQRILLQLFSLHKGSVVARGSVQFFHISKSGGTNLCQTAQANGCSAEGFDLRANCLVKAFGDTPRWVSFQAHKYIQYTLHMRKMTPWFVNFHTSRRNDYGCAARRAMLKQKGWDFYANEYTAPAGLGTKRSAPAQLCGEFVNLLLFRDPANRLRSQIVWLQKLYQAFYQNVDTSSAFTNKTSAYWRRLAPAAVDNYYIRSLLGQRHFEYPMTQLYDKDLHNAQLAAMQHDLLMTLENKDGAGVTLKVGLGWTNSLQEEAIRSSSTFANELPGEASAATAAVNKAKVPMPVDYDAMLAANQLDVQLYKFAEAMQAFDVFLFRSVALLDQRLGINNLSTRKCGYVSLARSSL